MNLALLLLFVALLVLLTEVVWLLTEVRRPLTQAGTNYREGGDGDPGQAVSAVPVTPLASCDRRVLQ